MSAESTPDRPFATLSDAELDARIKRNQDQQDRIGPNPRRAADKKSLRMLRDEMAQLINERNRRSDFEADYPIPRID